MSGVDISISVCPVWSWFWFCFHLIFLLSCSLHISVRGSLSVSWLTFNISHFYFTASLFHITSDLRTEAFLQPPPKFKRPHLTQDHIEELEISYCTAFTLQIPHHIGHDNHVRLPLPRSQQQHSSKYQLQSGPRSPTLEHEGGSPDFKV